ncbi:hypothetical protein [Endozoicomonas sp. ALB115]|uniref:hypothetical protein n=1 Tax=Endozoicomonas sp. ALB115 TaxID=3403074 RepID=UPI003BB5F005
MKYHPEYLNQFSSLKSAREYVHWYNLDHKHITLSSRRLKSGIPSKIREVLKRKPGDVYCQEKEQHSERLGKS